MVSTRAFGPRSWALVLLLLARAVVALENIFTYPTQEGLTFYQGDTVQVSWMTNMTNISLWTFCREKDDKGEEPVIFKGRIDENKGPNGSGNVKMEWKTDSDKCWFNIRDNDDEKNPGPNSVYFSMRSDSREVATTWKISEQDQKKFEEERKKQQDAESGKSSTTSSARSTTTTSSASSTLSTSAASTTATTLVSSTVSSASFPGPTDESQSGQNKTGDDKAEESNKDDSKKDKEGLSVGATAGIAVGVAVVVLGLIGLIVFFCMAKRRRAAQQQLAPPPMAPGPVMENSPGPEWGFPARSPATLVPTPPPNDLHAAGYYAKAADGQSTYSEVYSRADSTSPMPKPMGAVAVSELPVQPSHNDRYAQELPA